MIPSPMKYKYVYIYLYVKLPHVTKHVSQNISMVNAYVISLKHAYKSLGWVIKVMLS